MRMWSPLLKTSNHSASTLPGAVSGIAGCCAGAFAAIRSAMRTGATRGFRRGMAVFLVAETFSNVRDVRSVAEFQTIDLARPASSTDMGRYAGQHFTDRI